MWILALFLAIIAGALLARVALPVPGWRGWLASASLGVLFGPGLLSAAWFALPPSSGAVWGLSALLLAISAGAFLKFGAANATEPAGRFPWTWALAIALAIGVALTILDFQAATSANPNGDWDASAIWNLRARFLASGPELWRRAIAADIGGFMLGASHPGYPLFLSGYLAGLWTVAGNFAPEAAATLSLVTALAVIGLLAASLRTTALGLLAALVLVTTEVFAAQVAAQYADLLQGLAFLAALVFLNAAAETTSPRALLAAGLAIGLAPWIKNEGQPFAIAALLVAAWRFRSAAAWVLAGSLPGFLATAALKLMSEGHEAMFPATVGAALTKIADPGRWLQILAGFGNTLLTAGPWYAHPVVMVAALAFVLRFVDAPGKRLWLAIPLAATFAAEFGLYLVTTADLTWHISTSVSRLVAQLWPALLWFVLSLLRAPEEVAAAEPEVVKPAKARK